MEKINLSRRQALAIMGAIAVAPAGAFAAEDKPAAKGGYALQLYTMREPAKDDLARTLKKCREMGWEYVQWSGMPDLPAEKIKEALDTAGLKAISAHVGFEAFEQDYAKAVAFWKTVGVSALGPGGMMSDARDNLQAWLNGAKRLDAVAAKLKDDGIRLTFHNHNMEFEKFPGDPRAKLDILFESTKLLNMELDLAWVQVGGADPAAYLRKYKGRDPLIHVKDYSSKKGRNVKFAPLGKGVLDWPAIFAAAKDAGVEWYTYEQDNCEGDIFDCAKQSYDFLKKNLG
jgi:sugar phosphate isomerase/epimerase